MKCSMYAGDMVLVSNFGVYAPVMTTKGLTKYCNAYIRLNVKTIITLRDRQQISDTELEKIYPIVNLKYVVRQIINNCC